MARVRSDPAAATLTATAQVLAALAAFGAAWWTRFEWGVLPVEGRLDVLPARYLEGLPVAVLATLVAARAAGLGRARPGRLERPALRQVLAAAVVATLLLATAALLARDVFQYSRGFLALHGAFLVVFLPLADALARLLLRRWRRGRGPRVLLVGTASDTAHLAAELRRREGAGVEVAGWCGPEGDADGAAPRLGAVDDAPDAARTAGATRVVVITDPHGGVDEALLAALADGTADVALAWSLPRPAGLPAPELAAAGAFAVASYWESPLRGFGGVVKRVVDVVLALVALVVLSPVLVFLALLVKVTSRGPILHRQERVGLDGRTFTMLKFRTMIPDAEKGTGPVFAAPHDPRRTPVGAFLRRFSLDELPQVWNVLAGDMSLVGPRPERPEFVERFRREHPGYMLRHSLRAGITGWAQVNGLRGRSSIEDRLAYDLEYARRWSLLFDLEILARTTVQVLTGRNAY